jgi:hypothetical protein
MGIISTFAQGNLSKTEKISGKLLFDNGKK